MDGDWVEADADGFLIGSDCIKELGDPDAETKEIFLVSGKRCADCQGPVLGTEEWRKLCLGCWRKTRASESSDSKTEKCRCGAAINPRYSQCYKCYKSPSPALEPKYCRCGRTMSHNYIICFYCHNSLN